MKILHVIFYLYCAAVNATPIKETGNGEINTSNNTGVSENENNIEGESRAGIIDELNPFNKKPPEQQQSNKDNGNGQSNNNPLEAVQNLFSNAPQLFNGSNPFEQLFSSQSGGNFLDNMKIFLVGSQGIVMPASSMLSGFQNLMQAFGNTQNLLQPPSLPAGK